MADIELVIKIPEELYKKQLESNWTGNCVIHDAIVNGTPLPKGHGDLIDRSKLILDYDWNEYETDTGQLVILGYQAYSDTQIDNAPTIIEADKKSEDKG